MSVETAPTSLHNFVLLWTDERELKEYWRERNHPMLHVHDRKLTGKFPRLLLARPPLAAFIPQYAELPPLAQRRSSERLCSTYGHLYNRSPNSAARSRFSPRLIHLALYRRHPGAKDRLVARSRPNLAPGSTHAHNGHDLTFSCLLQPLPTGTRRVRIMNFF